MLVLTRKENQWVDIVLPDGTEIAVGINHVQGERVRLALDAPPEISIVRREIRHIPAPADRGQNLHTK